MIIRLIDLILEDSTDSATEKQAKALGLTYMYFGRWGKDGTVTHTTQNGTLVPVMKNMPTPNAQQTQNTTKTTDSSSDETSDIVDAGSISFDEFKESIPSFTEEDENIAEEDEVSGQRSIYSAQNVEEISSTIEEWKWGGEEGEGVWAFEEAQRQRVFDIVNKHIRDTNAAVKAPRLYRGVAFESNESAQTFLQQFVKGQSVELPPSGWAPDAETSMEYGPNNSTEPEVSAVIELEVGDSPIIGLSTTSVERNMGMPVIQREVITPGDVGYVVREVKRFTVTRDGRTQTVYKIVLRQTGYINEISVEKRKKYSMLAFMGGNMAMANNIRKYYKNK